MKFSIKDFFSKCDQIRRIWTHFLKKFLMEKFVFCALIFWPNGVHSICLFAKYRSETVN